MKKAIMVDKKVRYWVPIPNCYPQGAIDALKAEGFKHVSETIIDKLNKESKQLIEFGGSNGFMEYILITDDNDSVGLIDDAMFVEAVKTSSLYTELKPIMPSVLNFNSSVYIQFLFDVDSDEEVCENMNGNIMTTDQWKSYIKAHKTNFNGSDKWYQFQIHELLHMFEPTAFRGCATPISMQVIIKDGNSVMDFSSLYKR